MKSKEVKRSEAETRQKQFNSLTTKQKLDRALTHGGAREAKKWRAVLDWEAKSVKTK